jgi:hypothetical protein
MKTITTRLLMIASILISGCNGSNESKFTGLPALDGSNIANTEISFNERDGSGRFIVHFNKGVVWKDIDTPVIVKKDSSIKYEVSSVDHLYSFWLIHIENPTSSVFVCAECINISGKQFPLFWKKS